MLFYIISSRSKNIILEESIVEEYTGAAKNPNKLAEPNDDMIFGSQGQQQYVSALELCGQQMLNQYI